MPEIPIWFCCKDRSEMVSIHPRWKNEKERKVSEHGRSEKPCPKVSVKTSRQSFREDMTDSIKEGKEEKEHKAI